MTNLILCQCGHSLFAHNGERECIYVNWLNNQPITCDCMRFEPHQESAK